MGGLVLTEGRPSLLDARPVFVDKTDLDAAAEAFVQAMGRGNAEYLSANLRLTVRQSDALRALDKALVQDFNITRQEQIRQEQEAHRG
jgi:hypothetical protein